MACLHVDLLLVSLHIKQLMKSLATEYKTTRTHARGRHVPSDDQLEREEHWEGLDDGDASNPMTTTPTTTATTGEKTAAAAAVEVCSAMP